MSGKDLGSSESVSSEAAETMTEVSETQDLPVLKDKTVREELHELINLKERPEDLSPIPDMVEELLKEEVKEERLLHLKSYGMDRLLESYGLQRKVRLH